MFAWWVEAGFQFRGEGAFSHLGLRLLLPQVHYSLDGLFVPGVQSVEEVLVSRGDVLLVI